MSTIVLDGLNEEDFRRSIENRLREGRPGAAIERLRPLLAPYAKQGGLLPERFLEVEAADLVLSGWDALDEAVSLNDKPGRPVTAISIAFGWPGEEAPEPDAEGRLRPHVETSYYSDNAYPFSQSGREDLLEGYSFYGCTWSGDCEATDTVLSLEGIDDLHGALARLEAQLLASDEPDEDGIRAGSLGACLLSVLLVQAVAEQITRSGLPRPLCVMAGSSGMYPYFDAPVAGMPEEARKAAAALEEEEPEEEKQEYAAVEPGRSAPAPRYSSLLMTGIPRAKKRAVLVLNESDDELADRIAKLRNLNHSDIEISEIGEDNETGRESIPCAPVPGELELPEVPELVSAAATYGGPLLAQKQARRPRDLNDMFGLSPADPPAPGTLPREMNDRAEPAPPPILSEPLAGPGFTLLDPDLQQRLQSLIAASASAIAEAPRHAPPVLADQPESHEPRSPGLVPGLANDSHTANLLEARPAAAIAQPVRTDVPTPLRVRLWGKTKAWVASFSLWR